MYPMATEPNPRPSINPVAVPFSVLWHHQRYAAQRTHADRVTDVWDTNEAMFISMKHNIKSAFDS